jgi:hypothetical protein
MRTPPLLPAVTAWTASVARIAMLLATGALVVGAGGAPTLGPLLLAVVAAVVGHAVVAGSARAFRACDRAGRPTL